ncbi:MAG: hypothetical protein ACI4DW_07475 [Lachnospiraceae bacterium]
MADRAYKAFIVEGEAREPLIIDNISKVFFTHGNIEIITLPAGENIYMLWKKLKKDDFDTDIIEVLRESNEEIREQLAELSRDDFSEIYLFFDYDAHQKNLGKNDDKDIIDQMLVSFDNETENGKLYISYPMVEALRDFEPGVCGKRDACFVSIEALGDYKNTSSVRSFNPHFKEYKIDVWKDIIDVFAMRMSCLLGLPDTLEYEHYSERINPYEILILEKMELQKKRVFILSAFPEFLVDYFGVKLWKTCVRHTKNQLEKQLCKKE